PRPARPDAKVDVRNPERQRRGRGDPRQDVAPRDPRALEHSGQRQERGLASEAGGGQACQRSPTSASFGKENPGREDGEGDQIREREAHAFEGAGAEENSEPGEPAPAVSHRKQPPENQGQREPGGYVDDGVGVHDPGGPSERGGPRDPRSEDPAPAISQSIHPP